MITVAHPVGEVNLLLSVLNQAKIDSEKKSYGKWDADMWGRFKDTWLYKVGKSGKKTDSFAIAEWVMEDMLTKGMK